MTELPSRVTASCISSVRDEPALQGVLATCESVPCIWLALPLSHVACVKSSPYTCVASGGLKWSCCWHVHVAAFSSWLGDRTLSAPTLRLAALHGGHYLDGRQARGVVMQSSPAQKHCKNKLSSDKAMRSAQLLHTRGVAVLAPKFAAYGRCSEAQGLAGCSRA